MYLLARMPRPVVDFIGRINQRGSNRKKYFPIAVAYTVARRLALPTSEVTEMDEYYRATLSMPIADRLNQLNEILPFDYRTASALVQAFYRHRYASAFPGAIPLAFAPESAIVDFFGISKHFSKDTIACISKCPAEITQSLDGLSQIIDELEACAIAERKTSDAYFESQGKDSHVAA